MILAKYNTTTIELPDGTSVDAARRALQITYPELATADVDTNTHGVIEFKVKSGKKGASIIAKYNTTEIELPVGTSVEAARRALQATYPELAQAEVVTTANGFEFKVKSGKKG